MIRAFIVWVDLIRHLVGDFRNPAFVGDDQSVKTPGKDNPLRLGSFGHEPAPDRALEIVPAESITIWWKIRAPISNQPLDRKLRCLYMHTVLTDNKGYRILHGCFFKRRCLLGYWAYLPHLLF